MRGGGGLGELINTYLQGRFVVFAEGGHNLFFCFCRPFPSHSGMFLQNILHDDSKLKHSDNAVAVLDCGLDGAADMDNRAVDLLLGRYLRLNLLTNATKYVFLFSLQNLCSSFFFFSLNTSPLPLLEEEGFFPESLSGHSSVCEDSELNDPQYDQSLLENLFYKTPVS